MKSPDLMIDDHGRVGFRRDLEPETGAEKAWQHLQKLIDRHNDGQAAASQTAVNEALEHAAVVIGDMADAEQAAAARCPKCKRCDVSAAISLNAAAIKVRNMRGQTE